VHTGFEKFFRITPGKAPDADIAKVLRAFLTDLEGLRVVLESEECRIYSSSLLFAYEGDREALQEAIHLKEDPPHLDQSTDTATISEYPTSSNETAPPDEPTPPDRATLTDDEGTHPSQLLVPDGTTQPYEDDTGSNETTEDQDSDSDTPPRRIQALKLIDFAHAQWTKGQGPDENLLYGLKNVIKVLNELIDR
jgi:inositol-polyphosphate multikinase